MKSPSPIQQFKWAGESWAARYCPSNPFVVGGDGVQSFSHFRLFATPWTAARQASLFFSISQSLLKLMSIELMMPYLKNMYNYKALEVIISTVALFS